MSTPDRSRVIRLTEAQAHIPGLAGDRAVMVLRFYGPQGGEVPV
jgi:hypothetical protein